MLAQSKSARDYGRGELVFQQGQVAESLFVVIKGSVKIYREHENGAQVVVAILGAGETYFEPAMFVEGEYCSSAETASPARVMRLAASALRRAVLQQPRLAFDLFAASSLEIKQLVEQVEQIRTLTLPQRIADFFLQQVSDTSGSARFTLPYSKALIASLLGTKPEVFSRSLVLLRDQGVRVDREVVKIRDVAELARFSGVSSQEQTGSRTLLPSPFALLAKRRSFDDALVSEWRASLNSRTPISMLLIDVGHPLEHGSKTLPPHDGRFLSDIGKVISLDGHRDGRFMVHYGDEIFAVAAPATDRDDAKRLGEKIRTTIEKSEIRRGAGAAAPFVAAAVGTATIVPTEQDRIEKIVCYADIALYRAKTLGRRLVCSFHDDPSCETAKCSPSGGLTIPTIKSGQCAICRAGALRV
jgi:diguanylate cyclase (GGDEF)-like protein